MNKYRESIATVGFCLVILCVLCMPFFGLAEIRKDGTSTAAAAALGTNFTQNGGILVGTGPSAYQEEVGATARTSLGVAIGSDVQKYNINLDGWAGVSTNGGIDESNCDVTINSSLDLADASLQPAAINVTIQAYSINLDGWGTISTNGGVDLSQLDGGLQTSLGLADTALQTIPNLNDVEDVEFDTGASRSPYMGYHGTMFTNSQFIGFRAYRFTAQNNIVDNTATTIAYDDITSFGASDADGMLNTNTYIATLPRIGRWLGRASIYSSGVDDTKRCIIIIKAITGITTNNWAVGEIQSAKDNGDNVIAASVIIQTTTTNDTVWVDFLHLNGDNTPDLSGNAANSYFSVQYIGE